MKGFSQVIFRTIVPQQPVIVGESFAVQYVLEDFGKEDGFTPPLFNGLRLVSGPDTYGGVTYGNSGPVQLKNIVYTLVSSRQGWLTIPGATSSRNGQTIRSNDVLIEVISKSEAHARSRNEVEPNSEYFLKPGEDPYKKMEKNLYHRVSVDKRSCYIGQPVLATFKLYSRLESRSEIVKNPGFYGFTVHDIMNLSDKHSTTEIINGTPFDVHTIRMVQLYPLQSGNFTIDPMEVTNKVEFSKSVVTRKTEQKIVEGVFERTDPKPQTNTVSFSNTISTMPITIEVKPHPDKNKPLAFEGATGRFSIKASGVDDQLERNEQGNLLVTLKGSGNFVQLDAPTVDWPEGIEGFSPVITDSFDRAFSPLRGTRTYRFPFVASRTGKFEIPPVSISYFNPDTNRYSTISTDTIRLKITEPEVKEGGAGEQEPKKEARGPQSIWWMIVALAVVATVVYFIQYFPWRKKNVETSSTPPANLISLETEFEPAFDALSTNDPYFYSILQRCTWNYLGKSLDLSGSGMNKLDLVKTLSSKNVEPGLQKDLLLLLEQCEVANFTQVEPSLGKRKMLFRVKDLLKQMHLESLPK